LTATGGTPTLRETLQGKVADQVDVSAEVISCKWCRMENSTWSAVRATTAVALFVVLK
jgi:hypothetical protein